MSLNRLLGAFAIAASAISATGCAVTPVMPGVVVSPRGVYPAPPAVIVRPLPPPRPYYGPRYYPRHHHYHPHW